MLPSDYLDYAGKIYAPEETATQPRFVGYRCKHKPEPGARQTPDSMPEVDPSININGIPFTKEMQILSWEVMSIINPSITKKQWRAVFGNSRAYTNQNGFDGPTPRADFVNGTNLSAPLPKLMKGILAGGAFVRGMAIDGIVSVTPGTGAVDTTAHLPSAQYVINHHLYFVATTWSGAHVNNFPQGSGGPVAVVYFLNQVARYTGAWFQAWDSDALPDPLRIYL